MAISRFHKAKPKPRSPVLLLTIAAMALGLIWVCFGSSNLVSGISFLLPGASEDVEMEGSNGLEGKYLYWGNRIDCPGKHCDSCAGLGHQESSLRCALEEALFLRRVFVMPSRMCINPIHNKKGILHQPSNTSLDESACPRRSAAFSKTTDSTADRRRASAIEEMKRK